MTDHRVTDLSYGHLGQATYDPETQEWTFSVDVNQEHRIRQLGPLKEFLPPSIQKPPEENDKASKVARSQSKWLSKARPETFAANDLVSNFTKSLTITRTETASITGSLLAVGRAVDSDSLSGSRTPQILAMPCGEAGHVLGLVRPCVERYGWGKHSSVRLSVLGTDSSDQGHWIGTGGAIRQIIFEDGENGPGTWLAVRQATVITIFRPIYGKSLGSSIRPSGSSRTYLLSNLDPNPLVELPAERSSSSNHVDFSFNPWYARQFAVVDPLGRWSIWDIEGRHGKNSSFELVPGKSASFYDGSVPDPTGKIPGQDFADGWHRILWTCNISTIVLCNRRHLAVFDMKAKPIRLQIPDFLEATNTEWILDIKRSAVNFNHIFVLTTSRIIWIEVSPGGEQRDGHIGYAGAKIILSYRHFRDASDESLRLTTLKDDNVSVIISSSKSLMINFYCFSVGIETIGGPTSSRGSFTLFTGYGKERNASHTSLCTLYFLPALLTLSSSNKGSGPDPEDFEQFKFFQVWALTSDLGLSSTLCAVNDSRTSSASISAPTTKVSQSLRRIGSRNVKDLFIVPDEDNEEDGFLCQFRSSMRVDAAATSGNDTDDLRLRMNWRGLFEHVFLQKYPNSEPDASTPVAELLASVSDRIRHGVEEDRLSISTFLELAGLTSLSENLDQVASSIREFLDDLELDGGPATTSTLVLSDLTACPAIDFPTVADSESLDLMKIYDKLVEHWMASLPIKVSNLARGAKFKIIRQLAVEFLLSSIAISLQNKPSVLPPALPETGHGSLTLPALDDGRTTRESSPAHLFSSQMSVDHGGSSDFRLPTPTLTQTPSEYSHATSASEPTEDPAISRLRQYAVSIKSRPDFGQSRLLSHWPSTPGIDPASYSWEATQKTAASEEIGEGNYRNRREEARRRRRTEKFLKQERARAAETASQQSSVVPSGSQPAVAHRGFSSQTVDEMPMTQPDRGAFGSRPVQRVKKKAQKQRTAGF